MKTRFLEQAPGGYFGGFILIFERMLDWLLDPYVFVLG